MNEYSWQHCQDPQEMLDEIELRLNLSKGAQFALDEAFVEDLDMNMSAARGVTKWHKKTAKQACGIIREIVGNPYCYPSTFTIRPEVKPFWMTVEIYKCACHITATSDYCSTDILADMMEESGCRDEVILRHLRGEERDLCDCTEYEWGCPACRGTGKLGWWPKVTPCRLGCWVLRLIHGDFIIKESKSGAM